MTDEISDEIPDEIPGEIPDEEVPDEDIEFERPVRRYALILGGLFVLFTFCVFLHFLLVEQPRMEAAEQSVEAVE